MSLISGDPLDGIYEGTLDTTGLALGDHLLWVGGLDGAYNFGMGMETVHVEKAVFDISAISVSPNPANVCDTVTVSITVHNAGTISGTITIIIEIDGVEVINETVTLAPCDSYTATYTFHPEAGEYEVAGMGQSSVTLVVIEPTIQPSSTWVTQWIYGGVADTVATSHLVGVVDPIPDLIPYCPEVVPPAGMGIQADITFDVNPTRYSAGTPLTFYSMTAYSDTNGEALYVYMPGDTAGTPLDIEQANEAYTLISGSHIGRPYEVGQSWSYDAHNIAGVMGSMCMSEAHVITTVSVVAENQTVTVPAGTFTDCFEIQSDTAAPGLSTKWWSATAQGPVMQVDDQTWDSPEVWELVSYTLVW
jgi:hypothetical protein